VKIVYRAKNEPSIWTEQSVPLYSGYDYRFTWPSATHGKVMEFFIKVSRQNVPGHWVTRPAHKDAAIPSVYYQMTPTP